MNLIRSAARLCAALILFGTVGAAAAQSARTELYTADAVVTGQRAETRASGFESCLREVLVRVSGDPRLLSRPAFLRQLPRARDLVSGFRYSDRLAGVPVHDDQGTYDRPYDLHCSFDRRKLDALLAELGSRPWLAPRPRLKVVLLVTDARKRFILASGTTDGALMRESLLAEAASLGLEIVVPDGAAPATGPHAGSGADIAAAAGMAADRPVLSGSIAWDDAERVWEAGWTLWLSEGTIDWRGGGVTFDAAFREGLGGAAQVLSGNGRPE